MAYYKIAPNQNGKNMRENNVEELLPCPFCGGKPTMLNYHSYGSTHYVAQCSDCNARSVVTLSVNRSSAAWNTRYPDPVNGEEEDLYEPGVLYWHEALDRAHVARDHFFEYVEKHPAVMNDEELNIEAEKVTSAMNDFYHLVEAKYHEFETIIIDPVKADLVKALKTHDICEISRQL